jgi:hypothetical protein
VTVIWITAEERQRRAQERRERLERGRLMAEFVRWVCERAEHDGPVYVPELSSAAEARLLPLLRAAQEPPDRG